MTRLQNTINGSVLTSSYEKIRVMIVRHGRTFVRFTDRTSNSSSVQPKLFVGPAMSTALLGCDRPSVPRLACSRTPDHLFIVQSTYFTIPQAPFFFLSSIKSTLSSGTLPTSVTQSKISSLLSPWTVISSAPPGIYYQRGDSSQVTFCADKSSYNVPDLCLKLPSHHTS